MPSFPACLSGRKISAASSLIPRQRSFNYQHTDMANFAESVRKPANSRLAIALFS